MRRTWGGQMKLHHTALNHALPVDGGGFGLLLRSRTALTSVALSRTSRLNDLASPAAKP